MDVAEAQARFIELVDQVESGERVTITRGGSPVADLVPHILRPLVMGALAGQVRYDSDTFDDEDADVLRLFGLA